MNNQREEKKIQRRVKAKKKVIESIDQYHGGFIDSNNIKTPFDGMIELYDASTNKKLIPSFQFHDGLPISGISDIMRLLENSNSISDEAKCSFFLNPLFDTRMVIDILKDGTEKDISVLKREASLFLRD